MALLVVPVTAQYQEEEYTGKPVLDRYKDLQLNALSALLLIIINSQV
jgi:hypothetical protein